MVTPYRHIGVVLSKVYGIGYVCCRRRGCKLDIWT